VDGNLSIACFNGPSGVSVLVKDSDTLVVVSEVGNHVLRYINAITLQVGTLAGNGYVGYADGEARSAMFNHPVAVATSPDQSLVLVADGFNHRIRSFNVSNSSVSTLAGDGGAGLKDGIGTSAKFDFPSALCFFADGLKVAVTDMYNNKIRIIDLLDRQVTTLSTIGNPAFRPDFVYPAGIAITTGDVSAFVTDQYRSEVVEVDLSDGTVRQRRSMGNVLCLDGSRRQVDFAFPRALAISGNFLLISDSDNDQVRLLDLRSNLMSTILAGGLDKPQGLAVLEEQGIVIICNGGNHQITVGLIQNRSNHCA